MMIERYARLLTTGAAMGVVLLVGACSGSGANRVAGNPTPQAVPGAPDSANGTRATRLLLSGGESDAAEVPLGGRLGIDTSGCVTLGHYVIEAPRGSRLGLDGQTVTLTGIGEFRLGVTVSVRGSILTRQDSGCSNGAFAQIAAGTAPDAPAPDALACASGYSSGGVADYVSGGGEATAAEAISKAEVTNRSGRGTTMEQRLVENTKDRVRVSFLDPAGTVTGTTIVVKMDDKWQIEGMSACARVSAVAVEPGP